MGNSVIYRPAYDAEVEYLESTGTQWIDTGVYPNSATSFELKETLVSGRFMFGCWDGDVDNAIAYIITGEASSTGILFYRNVGTINNAVLNYGCGGLHIYSFRNKKLYIDNVEINDLPIQTDTERMEHSIYLFNRNANGGPTLEQPTNARIHSFQVTEDGVFIRDFIPVRIGQVGYLYDKVSKRLFANKGTGNFILGNDVVNAVIPQQRCILYFGNQRSVGFERIYEEYEWLVGDGTAYILHPNTDEFEIKINSSGYCTYEKGDWKNHGTMYSVMEFSHNDNIGWYSSLRVSAKEGGTRSVYRTNGIALGEHIIKKTAISNAIGVFTDGVRHFKNATTDVNYVGSDLIFYQLQPNSVCGVAYLTCSQFSFTPCKLLQPIPAILDGNGIARQAGECGMWDKVNNKFYGNVANSGTFTVKNPKCYEEYKWLVGEINVQGTMMQFTIGKNFSFKRRMYRGSNTGYFYGSGYSYYTNTSYYTLIIWETASSSNVFTLQPPTSGEDITIESTTLKLTFNGTEVPSYCNSYNFVITSQTNSGMKCATSAITVDGSVRYVPCKLTHGIPASMDANSIARPAGTCGMWDKVNDKFYGNVASSGTFTVSND